MRNGTLCSSHCAAEAQPRDRAALSAWRQFCEHQPSDDEPCELRAYGKVVQLDDISQKSLRQFKAWTLAQGWTASTAATYTCTLRRLMRNGTLCSSHCAAEAQPRDRAALRAWRQFCEHQPSNDDSQRCALRACGELKWRQYNDDNQPCGQSALAASADSHSSIESDDAAQHQKRKRRRVVPTMIDDSGQVVSFTDSMREQVRTLCGARLVPQDPA